MIRIALFSLLSACVVGETGETGAGVPADSGAPPTITGGDGSDGGIEQPPPGAVGAVLAFPGGTSIAVRWTGVAGATSYQIARNGVQIATQTPGYHPDFPERDGNGIIDASAVAGVAYTYTVTALGAATTQVGTTTATLASTTTPVPTLAIDSSQATDLAGWMQGTVRPFLETWYPKLGDALASPAYTAPHALRLKLDASYTGVAYTTGTSIVMSATYARAHQNDLGAWLHEATHALQGYTNMPGWIAEGIADYSREQILHDRSPTPPGPGNTYLTGYSEGAYFFAWITDHYAPTFVHDLNIGCHAGTYTAAFFATKTGKAIDALWTEMTGAPLPSPIHFAGLSNKCLQAGDSTTNHLQIATCNGGIPQGFGVVHNPDGTMSVANNHDCIDVAGSATASGSVIWMYGCNGSGAQVWTEQADGSLKNPASGKCMAIPSAPAADGTALALATCDGSSAQRLSPLGH